VEDTVEHAAPGFTDAVVGRFVQTPADLEAADANLAGGAVNGGTSAVHQELFLRPTPGLGRPETPVASLYLASASAHPGGGVHGACGWNAARAAHAVDARDRGRLGPQSCYGVLRSARNASRRSVSTLRGPITALRRGRGTSVPGPFSASSVIRTAQP